MQFDNVGMPQFGEDFDFHEVFDLLLRTEVLFNLLHGEGLVALGVMGQIGLAETADSDFLFYNVLLQFIYSINVHAFH
jgi:hypothetical protein